MTPRVIIYNAVSLDGRITGFDADLESYYGRVPIWKEDATLVSSETILAAPDEVPKEPENFKAPRRTRSNTHPMFVVVDSRGRIKTWHSLLNTPYWGTGVALCSGSTPAEHLQYLALRKIDYIVSGNDHVDLREALEKLGDRYQIETIRVDSGGILNGLLLKAGLVTEVSLLVHPSLVGGTSHHSFFQTKSRKTTAIKLKLIHCERAEQDLVWLRYQVLT
jgi:2,5-diamino-6-(ribosylamino)-4(3H)-pyrimidinone 5'-phosphate reductase